MSSVNEPLDSTPLSDTILGSTLISENETRFRVWAANCQSVNLEIVERLGDLEKVRERYLMESDNKGIFSTTITDCGAGTLYRFQLDNGMGRPDPRSNLNPTVCTGHLRLLILIVFNGQIRIGLGLRKKILSFTNYT